MESLSSSLRGSGKPRVFCYSRYDGAAPFTNHLGTLTELLEARFTLSALEDAEYFISLDHDPKILKKVSQHGIPWAKRFLIVREPRQVHPYSHSKKVRKDYSEIVYMGAVGPQGVSHHWPYDLPDDASFKELPSFRRERAIAIAGWRISLIRGSLYGLRAKAFSEPGVDLFGRDWNAPWSQKAKEIVANGILALRYPQHAAFDSRQIRYHPTNYQGAVEKKNSVLTAYKVSLVIENSVDYFSEKLFDSLVAGAIPVYCGPNPKLLGLPDGLVIWCEPRIESIRAGLTFAQGMDYFAWRKSLEVWLCGFDENSPMRAKSVWGKVVDGISSSMT